MNLLYVVSKLFTYLILPPGGFILMMLAGITRRLKFVLIAGAILLYLLSITPVANLLFNSLESPYRHPTTGKAKVVVVLGGGGNPHDVIKTGDEAFKRLMYGIILSKKYDIPLIFTGGSTKKPSDATLAKEDIRLIENTFHFKIKAYYEGRSLNTTENAKNTLKLIDALHLPKTIYLVTSAYHMKRSVMIFKNMEFKVVPRAVDFLSNNEPYEIWGFLPQMDNLYHSYKAIHEYAGILELYIIKEVEGANRL